MTISPVPRMETCPVCSEALDLFIPPFRWQCSCPSVHMDCLVSWLRTLPRLEIFSRRCNVPESDPMWPHCPTCRVPWRYGYLERFRQTAPFMTWNDLTLPIDMRDDEEAERIVDIRRCANSDAIPECCPHVACTNDAGEDIEFFTLCDSEMKNFVYELNSDIQSVYKYLVCQAEVSHNCPMFAIPILGRRRPHCDIHGECMMAVDISTGRRRWVCGYQYDVEETPNIVHHWS